MKSGTIKNFYFSLLVFQLIGCSDPPGWLLWSHTYSTVDKIADADTWKTYASFRKLADCADGLKIEVSAMAERFAVDYRGRKGKDTVQKDDESVQFISTHTEGNTNTSGVSNTRFFCIPIGIDPRPKDQSTWVLWAHIYKRDGSDNGSLSLEGSYLTQFACERARQQSVLIYRALQQTDREKAPVKVMRNVFCRPVEIDVHREFGVR